MSDSLTQVIGRPAREPLPEHLCLTVNEAEIISLYSPLSLISTHIFSPKRTPNTLPSIQGQNEFLAVRQSASVGLHQRSKWPHVPQNGPMFVEILVERTGHQCQNNIFSHDFANPPFTSLVIFIILMHVHENVHGLFGLMDTFKWSWQERTDLINCLEQSARCAFWCFLSTQAWETKGRVWISKLAELRGLTGASSTMSCSQE